jgi:hypothetical protein
MNGETKKRGIFWARVVIAAIVFYVLGFGPAVWLLARGAVPDTVVKCVYWPFLCQRVHLSSSWGAVLGWYGSLGIPAGKRLVITVGDLEGDTISASFGGAAPAQAN